MTIHLFLAIPVRLYNYKHIKQDFESLLEGKWRDEEHLHVTIAFLGQDRAIDEVVEKLTGIDFYCDLSEFSTFDYFTKSRVLVATTQNTTLENINKKLSAVFGLEPAELTPHVTLMRVKKITDTDAFNNQLKKSQNTSIGVLSSKLALYKSTLFPDGAKYEVLHEWPIHHLR